KQRHRLVHLQRASWIEYIRPMLEDHTFQRRFRMDSSSFKFLYDLLRPNLNRDVEIANFRNGIVAGEWALASTLRWLSGGSYLQMIGGPTMASSTAYLVLQKTQRPLTHALISPSYGRTTTDWTTLSQGTPSPPRLYSGHKKGFGLNLQVTSKSFTLPDGYYIIGDASYPPSDRLLTPYAGNCLCRNEDAFNFFRSQAMIGVEQAFGILVMTWGILWKHLRV
ncbi:unnamed protein product, partial [Discosporangium mesarthrocarpum]